MEIGKWKLHRSCRAADIHDEHTTAAAARSPLTFSTKNSASLATLMSAEADMHRARDKTDENNRDRRYAIFEWSAVVTILHRFQYRSLIHSDIKSRAFHTTPVLEAYVRGDPVRIW